MILRFLLWYRWGNAAADVIGFSFMVCVPGTSIFIFVWLFIFLFRAKLFISRFRFSGPFTPAFASASTFTSRLRLTITLTRFPFSWFSLTSAPATATEFRLKLTLTRFWGFWTSAAAETTSRFRFALTSSYTSLFWISGKSPVFWSFLWNRSMEITSAWMSFCLIFIVLILKSLQCFQISPIFCLMPRESAIACTIFSAIPITSSATQSISFYVFMVLSVPPSSMIIIQANDLSSSADLYILYIN